MHIDNALALNERIATLPQVYYFAVPCSATEPSGDAQLPIRSMMEPMFRRSSAQMGAYTGKTAGGFVIDKSWQENDGLVNTVSAMAPLGAQLHVPKAHQVNYRNTAERCDSPSSNQGSRIVFHSACSALPSGNVMPAVILDEGIIHPQVHDCRCGTPRSSNAQKSYIILFFLNLYTILPVCAQGKADRLSDLIAVDADKGGLRISYDKGVRNCSGK